MTGLPNQIVSLTDFSETSSNAANRAAELALIMKRPMTLLHISESIPLPSLADASVRSKLMEEDLQQRQATLLKAAEQLKVSFPRLALSTRLIADPAFDAGIDRYLQEMPASLLVLGKKKRSSLEKLFIGSNIKRLLRNGHFTVPMLLIPQELNWFELEHLILAVNLREKVSEKGFIFVQRLIEAYGITLGVVYSHGKDDISKEEVEALLKENLPISLTQKIQNITLVGAKEDILNTPYVSERPTDIVVAFPGKKGLFDSIVKGSFSEFLADNYEKPLLLVPQP
jgi:nucleotide-binding universal stress UspA family protein